MVSMSARIASFFEFKSSLNSIPSDCVPNAFTPVSSSAVALDMRCKTCTKRNNATTCWYPHRQPGPSHRRTCLASSCPPSYRDAIFWNLISAWAAGDVCCHSTDCWPGVSELVRLRAHAVPWMVELPPSRRAADWLCEKASSFGMEVACPWCARGRSAAGRPSSWLPWYKVGTRQVESCPLAGTLHC